MEKERKDMDEVRSETKLDAMDFVLDILKEHEDLFGTLVNRLDSSIDNMDATLIRNRRIKSEEKDYKVKQLNMRIRELENQLEVYKEKIKSLELMMASAQTK